MHSRSLFSFDEMFELMLYVQLNNFSFKPGCYSDFHQYLALRIMSKCHNDSEILNLHSLDSTNFCLI